MKEATTGPLRVTFFGDSVCVGQGVSIYRGWVPRVAQDLDGLSGSIGREVLVTNASVNGRTTRQALEDMPYQVQSHGVDILVVQFGLNDCNYWATDKGIPRVSRPAFMANLAEIMTRGRLAGARRILLNNNHPTLRSTDIMPFTSITYEQSNRAYNEAIREVARAETGDVVFTDIERAFLDCVTEGTPMETLLLADGLHLAPAGHDLYAALMLPALRKAVSEIANAATAAR